MNKYPTKLAIIFEGPSEPVVGESVFDGEGNPIGWIADAVERPDEPDEATMLKLHSRMNAALLDMNDELLAYHSQDRQNASSKKLIDSVIAAHQIIEDAATAGVGTCRNEWDEFGKFRCSECGLQIDSISTNTTVPASIRHCPNCGKRIIEETTE